MNCCGSLGAQPVAMDNGLVGVCSAQGNGAPVREADRASPHQPINHRSPKLARHDTKESLNETTTFVVLYSDRFGVLLLVADRDARRLKPCPVGQLPDRRDQI
jgi:hypothetical protein